MSDAPHYENAYSHRDENASFAYQVFKEKAQSVVETVIKELPTNYYGKDLLVEPVNMTLESYRDDISTGLGHDWRTFQVVSGDFEILERNPYAYTDTPKGCINIHYEPTSAIHHQNVLTTFVKQPADVSKTEGLLRYSKPDLQRRYIGQDIIRNIQPTEEELLAALENSLKASFGKVARDLEDVKKSQAKSIRRIRKAPKFVQNALIR